MNTGIGDVRVAGVLLAAGLSRRMGRPKPLVSLAGQPLVRHAAAALSAVPDYACRLVVVPPGAAGDAIRAALRDLPVTFAVNPEPGLGMMGSFRAAVQALPAGLDGVNFALADMPLVPAEAHGALLRAFAARRAPVTLAAYGPPDAAVSAPPHLFRADLLPAIRAAPDADHGPRHLLRAHAAQAVTCAFPAAWLLDVDTPAALAEAEARLREAGPVRTAGPDAPAG